MPATITTPSYPRLAPSAKKSCLYSPGLRSRNGRKSAKARGHLTDYMQPPPLQTPSAYPTNSDAFSVSSRRLLILSQPPRTLLGPCRPLAPVPRRPSGAPPRLSPLWRPAPLRLPRPASGTLCRPMDYSPPHTANWIYPAVFSARAVFSLLRFLCPSCQSVAASVVPVLAKSAFTMATPDSGTATAIAFRAPPFCSQDLSLWFYLLECSFKESKITSSLTKFNYAVSQLPSDVLPQVSAIISTAATADKPYEELKTALLKSLQSSIATHLHELLSKEELDDEKPSQLLHRMK
ncbi:hypothetical protein E2C01_034740 [Portunus trituberculatus]|uniref:DUF7041 domain-containing protein n=1 Tax=Portunus trituberculatus TaxID=210409 RepID=A0A5B7F6C5_PORTR|nr:hypothetical protein [Portunus trituberculatus]